MVRSFFAAAQVAVRMVHGNVASTFDYGSKTDPPWVAREHVLGISMTHLIAAFAAQRTKVPWALAGHIVVEAAEGVAAVRARIPPRGPPMGFLSGAATTCVVATEEGEVKIVDGRLPLLEGAPVVDSRGLPYWPPESVATRSTPGRCDVFGLAVVLWELIAGRRLFAGRDDGETHRLVEAMVVPALRTVSNAPPAIDEMVQRALGKTASHGSAVADAAGFARELRTALLAQGARARSGDAARLMVEKFAVSLAEQKAALSEAWAREQALQSSQDTTPNLTFDTEETTTDLKTMSERSIQTIVADRPNPFGDDEFDEAPTVSLSSATTVPNVSSPTSVPTPRLLLLPRVEPAPVERPAPPPPVRPSRSDPASTPFSLVARRPPPQSVPEPIVVRRPPPRSFPEPIVAQRPPPPAIPQQSPLVLPPVEQGPVLRLPPRPTPVSAAAQLARGSRRRLSVLVAGVVGFVSTFVIILVIALSQRPAPESAPPSASTSALRPMASASSAPSTRPAASSAPSTRPAAAPWIATIPVLSPGDLPRAPEQPATAAPRGRTPPRPVPAGRTGLLTVVCTPACDDVFDGADSLGPSPVFKVPVSVGAHRLRLHVEALPVDRVVMATVRENDTTVVRETLGE